MSITLSAKNLQKTYKSRTVVKDVSLEIGHEVIGLLGPNGAGKTTSFYMIVGLVQPEQGGVYLNGEEITHLPIHARARLGWMITVVLPDFLDPLDTMVSFLIL